MKNKKKGVFLILILLVIIIVAIIIANNKNEEETKNDGEIIEYTPQEEISSEQLRQTLITLYFKNRETGKLVPEARVVDSKILLNNPYLELVKLLIEGPKNENLEGIIPNETTVNNVKLEKGIAYIDFSEKFIETENMGAEREGDIIYSIVNTLCELTEVNGVKVLINGEENKGFASGKVNFNEIFKKQGQ